MFYLTEYVQHKSFQHIINVKLFKKKSYIIFILFEMPYIFYPYHTPQFGLATF